MTSDDSFSISIYLYRIVEEDIDFLPRDARQNAVMRLHVVCPSGDDWSFMGAIGLHAKLSANVIYSIDNRSSSKISGSIQNHVTFIIVISDVLM